MTVLISEVAQYLMDRNGQYILGDFGELQWKMKSFWSVMKAEIDMYTSYVPLIKKFNITKSTRSYDFTADVNNTGYEFGESAGLPPKFLTSVVPVAGWTMLSSMIGFNSPYGGRGGGGWGSDRLSFAYPFIWEYRKPLLTATDMGQFDIIANYPYEYKKIFAETDLLGVDLIDVEIPLLDDHDCYALLQDMMSARFLMTIGRSRRAFSMTDMPIVTDASNLVTEGQLEYDTAIKELYQFHPWYDALRP